MTTIRCFQVRSSGKPEPYPSLEEALARFRKEKGFLWVDVVSPTREALAPLSEALAVSDLTIEDCVETVQIPKLENCDGYTFLLINPCYWRDGQLPTGECDLLIGRDFLVTTHSLPPEVPDALAGLDEFVSRGLQGKRLVRGPDTLAHLILDHFIDRKFSTIEAIQDAIDRAEDTALERPEAFDPGALLDVRRSLLKLRKILYHEREIMLRIGRRDSPFVVERAVPLFRDLFDHLSKYYETAEIEREMVGNLMDLHMAGVNNRLALASNEINQTMRKLTVITTVFMPLTFLSGALGMSEWSMMTGPENWRVAYTLFFAGSALLGLFNYLLLRYARWI